MEAAPASSADAPAAPALDSGAPNPAVSGGKGKGGPRPPRGDGAPSGERPPPPPRAERPQQQGQKQQGQKQQGQGQHGGKGATVAGAGAAPHAPAATTAAPSAAVGVGAKYATGVGALLSHVDMPMEDAAASSVRERGVTLARGGAQEGCGLCAPPHTRALPTRSAHNHLHGPPCTLHGREQHPDAPHPDTPQCTHASYPRPPTPCRS